MRARAKSSCSEGQIHILAQRKNYRANNLYPVLILDQECSEVWYVEIRAYHSCGTVAKSRDLWYFSITSITNRTILHFFHLALPFIFQKKVQVCDFVLSIQTTSAFTSTFQASMSLNLYS